LRYFVDGCKFAVTMSALGDHAVMEEDPCTEQEEQRGEEEEEVQVVGEGSLVDDMVASDATPARPAGSAAAALKYSGASPLENLDRIDLSQFELSPATRVGLEKHPERRICYHPKKGTSGEISEAWKCAAIFFKDNKAKFLCFHCAGEFSLGQGGPGNVWNHLHSLHKDVYETRSPRKATRSAPAPPASKLALLKQTTIAAYDTAEKPKHLRHVQLAINDAIADAISQRRVNGTCCRS